MARKISMLNNNMLRINYKSYLPRSKKFEFEFINL